MNQTSTIGDLLKDIIERDRRMWFDELTRILRNPADLSVGSKNLLDAPLTRDAIVRVLHLLGHVDASSFRYVRENRTCQPSNLRLKTISGRCIAALAVYCEAQFRGEREVLFRRAAIGDDQDRPALAEEITQMTLEYPNWFTGVIENIQSFSGMYLELAALKERLYTSLYQAVHVPEDVFERLLFPPTGYSPIVIAVSDIISMIAARRLERQPELSHPLQPLYCAIVPVSDPGGGEWAQAIAQLWGILSQDPIAPTQYAENYSRKIPPMLDAILTEADNQLRQAPDYLNALFAANGMIRNTEYVLRLYASLVVSDYDDFERRMLRDIRKTLQACHIPGPADKKIRTLLLKPHMTLLIRYLATRLNLAAYLSEGIVDLDEVGGVLTVTHLLLLGVPAALAQPNPADEPPSAPFVRWLWTQAQRDLPLTLQEEEFIDVVDYPELVAAHCPVIRDVLPVFFAKEAMLTPEEAADLGSKPITRENLVATFQFLDDALSKQYRQSWPHLAGVVPVEIYPGNEAMGNNKTQTCLAQLMGFGLLPLAFFAEGLYGGQSPVSAYIISYHMDVVQRLGEKGPYQVFEEHSATWRYFTHPDQAALFSYLTRSAEHLAHYAFADSLARLDLDPCGYVGAYLLALSLKCGDYPGQLPPAADADLWTQLYLALRQAHLPSTMRAEARHQLATNPDHYIPANAVPYYRTVFMDIAFHTAEAADLP